jgi:hypothetical protein
VLWIPEHPSDFCDYCGAPHPWASRQARIFELENLLDQDDSMDEPTRLKVREQLEVLARDPSADTATEAERWATVKKLWPNVVDAGQTILVSVVTSEVRRTFGLPP